MAVAVSTVIDHKSKARMTRTVHAISDVEHSVMRDAPLLIAELTRLLKDKVGEEFEKSLLHPDQSTGASMKTLKAEAHGLGGVIEAAGGFPYKEFGTQDHMVAPTDSSGVLHWTENGQDFFSKGHMVSGIKPDDFVGRAIEQLDAEAVMLMIFERSFLDVFTEDI